MFVNCQSFHNRVRRGLLFHPRVQKLSCHDAFQWSRDQLRLIKAEGFSLGMLHAEQDFLLLLNRSTASWLLLAAKLNTWLPTFLLLKMPCLTKARCLTSPLAHSRRGVRLKIARKDSQHLINITVKIKEDRVYKKNQN